MILVILLSGWSDFTYDSDAHTVAYTFAKSKLDSTLANLFWWIPYYLFLLIILCALGLLLVIHGETCDIWWLRWNDASQFIIQVCLSGWIFCSAWLIDWNLMSPLNLIWLMALITFLCLFSLLGYFMGNWGWSCSKKSMGTISIGSGNLNGSNWIFIYIPTQYHLLRLRGSPWSFVFNMDVNML